MENLQESDDYSEEIDRAFSSFSELIIDNISEHKEERVDVSRYPISEIPLNASNSSTQYDEKSLNATQSKSSETLDNSSSQNYVPKGQTFDVSNFSICEIFDNAPNSSRKPKPYDYNRFSERGTAPLDSTMQNDEALYFDNEQFYINEYSDDARIFDAVHRYSIGEILEGAPDSKKSMAAGVRFKKMEEELSNLFKQCFEKDEYIRSLTMRLKDSGIKASELRKNLFLSERRNEVLEKNLEEAKSKVERAQEESAEAKALVVELKSKSRKKVEADLERQLKQVVQQHEKQKMELESSFRSANDKFEDTRKELEAAKTENKLLSRQKSELFSVVTNQMKLIANLRRQILHLRAGVLKDFTEEEIRKAIEKNRSS